MNEHAPIDHAKLAESMPLEDINRAFDLMHHGESIRSVVLFD